MRRMASLAAIYASSCRSVIGGTPYCIEFRRRPPFAVVGRVCEAMINSFLRSMARNEKSAGPRQALQAGISANQACILKAGGARFNPLNFLELACCMRPLRWSNLKRHNDRLSK